MINSPHKKWLSLNETSMNTFYHCSVELLPLDQQPPFVQTIQKAERQFSNFNQYYHTGFAVTGYREGKPTAVFIADWAEVPHHSFYGVIQRIQDRYNCLLLTQYAHGCIAHFSDGRIDQKKTDQWGNEAFQQLAQPENQVLIDIKMKEALSELTNIQLVFTSGIAAKQIAHFRRDPELQNTGISKATQVLIAPYLKGDIDTQMLLKMRRSLAAFNCPAACGVTEAGCFDVIIGIYSRIFKKDPLQTQLSKDTFFYNANQGIANRIVPMGVLDQEANRLSLYPTVPEDGVLEASESSKVIVLANLSDPYMTGKFNTLKNEVEKNFLGCVITGLEIQINAHAITHLLGRAGTTDLTDALLDLALGRSNTVPEAFIPKPPSTFPICSSIWKPQDAPEAFRLSVQKPTSVMSK